MKLIKFFLIFLFYMGDFFSPRAHAVETFLFSFEKDNQESYLLGTLHGVDPMRLPSTVLPFLNDRSVLMVENIDIQKPLDKESLASMGVLKEPDDVSFSINMLMADDKSELLDYVNPFLLEKGGQVQADQLNLKGLYAAYIGGHFLSGLDYWLLKSFKQAQKEVYGLETREDVSGFFEDVTFENLEQIIKYHAGFDSPEALKMEEDYLTGVAPSEESSEFEEEMRARNAKWLDHLIEYHIEHSKKMVVAVGFAHLFGQNGLLKLLSHKGFTLKRMNSAGDFIAFNL